MESVIVNGISVLYENITEEIKRLENKFFVGLLFVLLWSVIIGISLGIIWLSISINKWIGIGIIIAIVVIEFFTFLGKKLSE